MDVKLTFPSAPQMIAGMSDLVYNWGINGGLKDAEACGLAVGSSELITDIMRFAYDQRDEEIEMRLRATMSQVEVIVRETGAPFRPERYIYDIKNVQEHNDFTGAGLHLIEHYTDDFIYINRGKQGKEFRLIKRVSDPHIAELMGPEPVVDQMVEPETGHTYTVDLIRPDEADDISKLIYRVYRHSYFKDVLYYPKKLQAAIERGDKFGAIARTENGEPCGYFAVIRNADANIGEVGEALVLTAHRKRGLMKRMLQLLIDESARQKLLAVFGEANAAHIFSQRANARFNMKSTALLLAQMPPMQMSGIASEQTAQAVSAVIEYVALLPMARRSVYLPAEYSDLLMRIYQQFDVEVELNSPSAGWKPGQECALDIQVNTTNAFVLIVIRRYGADLIEALKAAKVDLINQGILTINVDLPLETEGTAHVTDQLRSIGFVFGGLMLFFHDDRDYLRMQHTVVELDFDKICTYTDIASEMRSLIQQELHAL